MRQQSDQWQGRIAFRVARRVGILTHDARAWLNEQLTLARSGLREGDAEALSRAYAKRYAPCLAAGCEPSRGLYGHHVEACPRAPSRPSISDATVS